MESGRKAEWTGGRGGGRERASEKGRAGGREREGVGVKERDLIGTYRATVVDFRDQPSLLSSDYSLTNKELLLSSRLFSLSPSVCVVVCACGCVRVYVCELLRLFLTFFSPLLTLARARSFFLPLLRAHTTAQPQTPNVLVSNQNPSDRANLEGKGEGGCGGL